nr:uncharacterized protein LOC116775721 isoform X3 [Danaus plexippus plexippus]
MVEEVEIKIEYFDSNEIDPLKEYKNQESKKNPTLQNDENSMKLSYILKETYEDNLNTKLKPSNKFQDVEITNNMAQFNRHQR